MAKNSTPKTTGAAPDADSEKKMEAVRMAMEAIEKQYGRGSIMRFGEAAQKLDISVVSTGCLPLDLALGVGGLPRGRIIEIYGPEASGKTTICLSVIAQAQKHGGVAAFIDAEHALDPMWAQVVGVKLDELLISQPDTGEQALEIAESLVRSGGIDVLVIDSVAALVPRAEIEGEMGDAMVGLQARLMSQALRKLTAVISKSKTVVIFT
ncbi:MAG TPA: DNA recombination/repair protein RecA, partial [Patescibacteria group bacterium]|nr:DNA recombination/repair protein RecA [Patescibacteria group bacterium]